MREYNYKILNFLGGKFSFKKSLSGFLFENKIDNIAIIIGFKLCVR